jgi:hypothetical protein
MHPSAILHEVQQLHNVSDRLDSLAEQHPVVSKTLLTISGIRYFPLPGCRFSADGWAEFCALLVAKAA